MREVDEEKWGRGVQRENVKLLSPLVMLSNSLVQIRAIFHGGIIVEVMSQNKMKNKDASHDQAC